MTRRAEENAMNKFLTLTALLAVTALPMVAPAQAAEGSRLKCVRLMSIDDSPVINESTVLLKMKSGQVHYKRIDLAAPCTGIDYQGFSHQTGYDELCTSDTLIPNVPGGGVCKIKDIVDIGDTEAKDLMAHHGKK
jgi:hypothetical protein